MQKKEFKKLLESKAIIADGAMGTVLYQQGFFLNCCYDELNLTQPKIIEQIHSQYIEAGSDFITTNTYGANSIRLGKFGLADKAEAINTAAVEIARRAAQNNALVAGSIGPTGIGANLCSENADKIFPSFVDQAKILCDAGVDFLLLETFTNFDELNLAIKAASQTKLPIVAQMALQETFCDSVENSIEYIFQQLSQNEAVDAVGLNCILGPAQMLEAVDMIMPIVDKPLFISPNAGLPQNVDGRVIYVSTPEYMAEYAKRFFQKGVKIIGGCCGTTSEHVRQITKAVKAIEKSEKKHVEINIKPLVQSKAQNVQRVPLENCSSLGKKLVSRQKVYTIEISPPKGTDISVLLEKVAFCKKYGIDAVNIPDGPRASSRLSATMTALKIRQSVDIETLVHFCCRDRNLIGIQSDLLGMNVLDLHNVLLITGDPPKLGEFPDATAVFDLDAISLCKVVDSLNQGVDIASNSFSPPTSFAIGVGVNPVAVDLQRELERFEQKVSAGAQYAITQPVFDPEALIDFIGKIKHLNIPIIAGIWPFTSYKNAHFMANEVPGVSVPQKILDRMQTTTTAAEGKLEGVKIANEMVKALHDHVAGFALSAPFGNVKMALAAIGKIELDDIF